MGDYSGEQVGHYLLLELIGEGGFSEVYLGEHVHLGTLVAVKILKRSLASQWRRRFLLEARIAAALHHDHILPILDFGVYKGTPYLVMQLAPHDSLRKQYPRGTAPDFATMLGYLQQLASALDYLHELGLFHLDIKPENLLLGDTGRILLSDFGITEMASNNQMQRIGTPAYMAPEQIAGYATAASDQYALAIVIYEWLTGRLPFVGTRQKILDQQRQARPRSICAQAPDVTPAMERVVFRALRKDPRRRYPSVQAFVEALRQATFPPLPQVETLTLKQYLLKIETWEEVSKFFISKMFSSAVIAFFAFLLSRSMDIMLFTFGACIPLMPLQEIFRRRNLLGQSIAYCAFFIALPISFVLHSFSAFLLAQVSLLIVCIWIVFLRKHIPRLRLDASFINKLRMWFDLFKRLIL